MKQTIGQKDLCENCKLPLGPRAYQGETGNWVATGKFPTHDFCSRECYEAWRLRNGLTHFLAPRHIPA
jgi:hypothetical protein